MAEKPKDVRAGDTLTIEVEVVDTWEDGRITFQLAGYPVPITISAECPDIVSIDPTSPSRQKGRKR
ncbi:hypothetical protein IG197_27790 [Aminobacter sp. SR38]|jgi:hypothetical protein|uniref:hypothetical protein n=1 Tax=Aminobacter sp. SR38 TaxID=2774562 RepID=UPI001781A3F8|nr:hypothetical protein [Aminobacter sp. SR38]QOF71496.1 hypothetical protein IG197_27790 [Aminobacter sp. SR38]